MSKVMVVLVIANTSSNFTHPVFMSLTSKPVAVALAAMQTGEMESGTIYILILAK
jgi:hypothetical protein